MDESDKINLIAVAKAAANNAYAKYSHFHVGAAALDENGKIYKGCNVENISYGLTCCAERVSLFKAISEGAGKIIGMALFSPDLEISISPCGACRQVMAELAPEATVLMADTQGKFLEKSVQDLLPLGFKF